MLAQTPGISAKTYDDTKEANRQIAVHLEMLVDVLRQHAQRLKQQNGTMSAGEVGLLLEGFGSKIEAVSRLHSRLVGIGGDRATVQLGDYLNQLSAHLTEALPIRGRVGLDLELDAGCRVATDRALPIGLIVCELVTNAAKHAHPTGIEGHVTVRCRRMGPYVAIEVEDDGVGLPESLDPHTDGSPGIRTVRDLAEEIGGTVRYRNDGLGLVAELRVPAAADHHEAAA